MSGILYEDEAIRVMFAPMPSALLVITFGDLVSLANGEQFFADKPLAKSGTAALGIMAKREHWYPAAPLQRALPAILAKIGPYRTRLAYGGSMGGYAAIRFSRLFGVTHVLALCPQWSIDAAECEGEDPGWEDYFEPSMRGMGIRPADVSGRIFLFTDARHPEEAFHSRMILKNAPGSTLIHVPNVGHDVTAVFAGTAHLQALIKGCLAEDLTSLRRISHLTRRPHLLRKRNVLRRALEAHPQLGADILAARAASDLEFFQAVWRQCFKALGHVHRRHGVAAALAYYERIWRYLPGPLAQLCVCAFVARLIGGRVALRTAFGTELLYDLAENGVLHHAQRATLARLPVELDIVGNGAQLSVSFGGTRFQLGLGEEQIIGIHDSAVAAETRFIIAAAVDGCFTLRQGEYFLCAQPHGDVMCNRLEAGGWEMFSVIPVLDILRPDPGGPHS